MNSRHVHHLVDIKGVNFPAKSGEGDVIYTMGCGRTYKFWHDDRPLLSCSHIEMVNCKQCLRKYKMKVKNET